MGTNHTPTNYDNTIIRSPHANYRRRLPDYVLEHLTARIVNLATALRKSKRASKAERRSA